MLAKIAPWQPLQFVPPADSPPPSSWPLMWRARSTVVAVYVPPWQVPQLVDAVTPAWPPVVGGSPWQLPQLAAAPFQVQVATEPAYPTPSEAPWQYTAQLVWVVLPLPWVNEGV
jgi:hypothetical protein